jgi:rhodanese-related sulfurtransferase
MSLPSRRPARRICALAVSAPLVAALFAAPAHGQLLETSPWPTTPTKPTAPHSPSAASTGIDALSSWELQDLGVAAPRALHSGAFHGPTPNRIPGGQVITTQGLMALLQRDLPVHVFDVLGGQVALPHAVSLAWAAQPGSFDDATQQQLARMLIQATRGRMDAPLVFYCQSPQCWMSYNAAARAIHLGYRNVLWYRGGVEAWQRAGQPLVAAADAQGSR